MKKDHLYSTSRLAVLALACVAIIGFSACSSDDGDGEKPNNNIIIGTWVSEPGKPYVMTYYFGSDGRGEFSSSNGASATFNYTTTGGYYESSGGINMSMVYHYDGTVSRTERSGSYSVFGNDSLRLRLGYDTELYIRKK